MDQEFVTAGEAARLLGCQPGTIRQYARRGHLAAIKLDATRSLYRRADVEALLASPPKRTGAPKRSQTTDP